MIEITFDFKKEDELLFKASGHGLVSKNGEFATKGSDILCAGVSSLIQAILIGLKFVAKANIEIIKKQDGYLEFIIKDISKKENNVLIRTLFLSLKNIEKNYSDSLLITEKR